MGRRKDKVELGHWLEEEEEENSDEGSSSLSQGDDDANAEEEEEGEEVEEDHDDDEDNSFSIGNCPAKSELLDEIFSRLPPPSLFKFRIVSKSFCDYIKCPNFAAMHSRNCKSIAGKGITGIFLQGERWDILTGRLYRERYGIEYFRVESEAGGVPDPSFQFLKQQKDDKVGILDSCNGLALCITIAANKAKTCFVCNPLTKEKLALPHPRLPSGRLFYALMADYSSNGRYLKYKVVCMWRPKLSDQCQSPKLAILSSENGEWKVFDEAFPPLNGLFEVASKVYFNGSLYWDCLEGYILVCHLNSIGKQQASYQLIKAPQAILGRSLWKSEDKLHCYCHGFEDKFPEWTMEINDKRNFEWKIEDGKQFNTLCEDVSELRAKNRLGIGMGAKPQVQFNVIAYAPKHKTIFLLFSNCIYTYQFPERRLVVLSPSPETVVPYVHNLVPICIGAVGHDENAKGKKKAMKGKNQFPERQDSEELEDKHMNKVKLRSGRKRNQSSFSRQHIL